MTTGQTGSRAELLAWNAANVRARRDGQRPRNNSGPQTASQLPDETVSRETYMDQVRANAELARTLKKTVAELEAAKRTIIKLQSTSNNLR